MATVKVGADGKAPKGLKANDLVITGGGTYVINGVNADGSYKSSLLNKGVTTSNYTGGYSAPSVSNGIGSTANSTDYSVLLNAAMQSGAPASEVQSLLDSRVSKALGSPELNKYAYDDVYNAAMQYINERNGAAKGYDEFPDYTPSEKVSQAIGNIEKMNYTDWKNTDGYADLMKAAETGGKRAMEDTLGSVSARTGGIASSYAVQAANEAYNNYLANAEAQAYDRYRGELDNLYNLYEMYYNGDNNNYNRAVQAANYRDTQAQQELARRQQELENLWAERNYNDTKALNAAQISAQGGDYSALADYYGISEDAVKNYVSASKKTSGSGVKTAEPKINFTDIVESLPSGLSEAQIRAQLRNAGITNATELKDAVDYYAEIENEIISKETAERAEENKKYTSGDIEITDADGKVVGMAREYVENAIVDMINSGATKADIKERLDDALNVKPALINRQTYEYLYNKYVSKE